MMLALEGHYMLALNEPRENLHVFLIVPSALPGLANILIKVTFANAIDSLVPGTNLVICTFP
jgi:hypothetical protein